MFPLKQYVEQLDHKVDKKRRLKKEEYWIKNLQTLTPYGLNDRLGFKDWRFRSKSDIAGKCFVRIRNNRRGVRGSKKSKDNYTLETDKILHDLKKLYENFDNWRHQARVIVNHLNKIQLHELSWVLVDKYITVSSFPREITDLLLDMVNFRIHNLKREKVSPKPKVYSKSISKVKW